MILRDNLWAGRRAFVVGGGPSLRGFDFSLLAGEHTIGCNTPPDKFIPSIWISIDQQFWEEYSKIDHPCKVWATGPRRTSLDADLTKLRLLPRPSWSTSLAHGIGDGDNTGFSALNLAWILGANPIYLLGFDLKGEDGLEAHWHDSVFDRGPETVYEKFKKTFETLASSGKIGHRKIINLNPGSALECFERRPCGDVLDWRWKI